MSISIAMSNAVLGLRAAGRGAEVISSNVANALTPGYGKRLLTLTSNGMGGVNASTITRDVDAGLVSDRRTAEAANTNASLTSDFFTRVEALLGTPDDEHSLSARFARLEGDLVTASSRPDASERLTAVVNSATDLALGLRTASEGVQAARTEADRTIATQVRTLNAALEQVQALNVQITANRAKGNDISGLQDQRQLAVDQIGTLVPVRELQRDGGQIALYSMAGAALVDGSASTIGFDASHVVTPYASLADGTLSGLTINDQPVRTSSENGALSGGALAAHFATRDELGPAAQAEIDALARDLVERFQDPTVDPTLTLGDAGLFTDEGAAFDSLNENGLAGRLSINAAVDPDQGGQTWRIRDGINALVEGPVGESTLLLNLTDALTKQRAPASGGFAGTAQSASSLVSSLISEIGGDRTAAEQHQSYTSARFSELTTLQMADGVDTDEELQRLMQVEQSYAANARLLETIDEMMQILNRL